MENGPTLKNLAIVLVGAIAAFLAACYAARSFDAPTALVIGAIAGITLILALREFFVKR